jgi:hypothetical protein
MRSLFQYKFRIALGAAALLLTGVAAQRMIAADRASLNPAAIKIELPKEVKWVENTQAGNATAVVSGDPAKEGMYVVLTRWHPGHMSRPHFHPNDRFITVIEGTWWVSTSDKYDPNTAVPLPAGSVVTHYGKQIHYDGAKDGDVTLMIVGMGPATSMPAEKK